MGYRGLRFAVFYLEGFIEMKFLLKDICKIDRKDLTLYSLYPEQGSYISWEDLFTQFNIELYASVYAG